MERTGVSELTRFKSAHYSKKLKDRGIESVPLQKPSGHQKQVKHRCRCGSIFYRSPKDMLSTHATGVCGTCAIKRRNKIRDTDNGYQEYCLKNGFSLPVNRFDYIDRHTPIPHKCISCDGIWTKAPGKSYRSSYLGVCPKCTSLRKAKKRKNGSERTFELYLKSTRSKTTLVGDWLGLTSKTVFSCGKCRRRFFRAANKVLAGQYYCIDCRDQKRSKNQVMSLKELKQRIELKGLTCRLISKAPANQYLDLCFKCECGSNFWRRYPKVIGGNGSGLCIECGMKQKANSQTWSADEYDQRLAKDRVGIKRIGAYIGSQAKTQHKCICGNTDWYPKPNNLLQSYDTCGCGIIRRSEELTRQIFEGLMRAKFPRVRPPFLRRSSTGATLELDGFNPRLKLAFEYQGRQHKKQNARYHRDKLDFLEQQKRDEEKRKLCDENSVILVYIDDIESRLRRLRKNVTELNDLVQTIRGKLIELGYNPKRKSVAIDWNKLDLPKLEQPSVKSSRRMKSSK